MGKSLIEIAKAVIQTEADSVLALKDRINNKFEEVCNTLKECPGRVVLIGMGKSGHIAKKISSTLASTGTPSFYLHPGEAGHGDLGMVTDDDVVIMISYSGEADEIIALLPSIKRMNIPLISMTGNAKSSIAISSDYHLDVSVAEEACPNNLAPTSSTTSALVMGDAIAVSLITANKFSPEDFAMSHPSGSLGRRLLTLVSSIMQSGNDIPMVSKKTLLIDNDIQAIASTFNQAKGSMFLGRGFSYHIALEGALKLKELSYVHAEGYPAGEMKHGPLALIEEGMPVVVLAPRDNYYKKTISNMQEVIARGAKVLLITNKSKDDVVSENIWETIEVESTNQYLLPFLLTIPLQKLAYYSALKKGFDIDKPRNLAKSVTVE